MAALLSEQLMDHKLSTRSKLEGLTVARKLFEKGCRGLRSRATVCSWGLCECWRLLLTMMVVMVTVMVMVVVW